MIAGIFSTLSRVLAGSRGLGKISLGLNPNQPLELRSWIGQFFQGGGGAMSSARDAGMSAGAQQSIIDNMNRRPSQPPPQARS